MKIYYVRHGQTDWNLARKMQGGETERPLNETGIEQAKQARQALENVQYDLIIRSPMQRVEETVQIINENKNVPVIIDERIREIKLGKLEGHSITPELENKIWDYKLNYQNPEGESLYQFEKRILEFIKEIKQKYNDKTILIVAHGGVAKIFKSYFYGMPKSKNLNEIKINNCEILEIEV